MSRHNESKIIFDPYKSATLMGYSVDKIVGAYNRYWNDSETKYEGLSCGNKFMFLETNKDYVISTHERVPSFLHPIIDHDTGNILIDVRPYTSYDKSDKVISVKNDSLYRIDHIRAALMYTTFREDVSSLAPISKLPALVYATSISKILTTRDQLEASSLQVVMILSLMYFTSKFSQENVWGDEDKARQMAKKYAGALRVDVGKILELAELNPPLNDLEDLCSAIREYSGSLRLENVNSGHLLTLSRVLWYGPNAADLVAVALDDPATFMALCYASSEEFNYKKTSIGLAVKVYKSHADSFKEYIRTTCLPIVNKQ